MKTPTQKFKSKINKIIIRLTNSGNHTAASHLYQTYFLYKKSLWKTTNKKVSTTGHVESLDIPKMDTYMLTIKKYQKLIISNQMMNLLNTKNGKINCFYSLTSYYPLNIMQPSNPRVRTAQAIKIENKKSFYAMILFIVLFFGASYYAPEHIEGYNPQQTATQRKWKSKELEQIPRPQNYAGFLLLIYSTSHRTH